MLAIEGEPGIGKSRLLAHVADTAADATVLAARASEYETDLPYALLIEALGSTGARPALAGGADRHHVAPRR